MNWKQEFKNMRRWLNTNYYFQNREWVYKDLKPRIVCEKYLEDEEGNIPRDYKIFCFNGIPEIIIVDLDRFGLHSRNIYDKEWNFLHVENNHKPNDLDNLEEKPSCLNEMLELSKKLSHGFPHVRVDFYIINNRPIFGELTFWHASGWGPFKPENFELELGSKLRLPK